jgi:uncharacterized protein
MNMVLKKTDSHHEPLRKSINLRGAIVLIVLSGLLLSRNLVHLLTESWWFDAVGFSDVFWTKLTWQILLWLITFIVYAVWLWVNYQIVLQATRHRPFTVFEETNLELHTDWLIHLLVRIASILVALAAASITASGWDVILKYLHRSPFGDRDPIFQRDIGFWIFQLPVLEGIRGWLFGLLSLGLALSLVVYTLKGVFAPETERRVGDLTIKTHLSLLLSGLVLLVGWGFWLERFHILYEADGLVFGAGYTDVHARLLALNVLSLLSVGVAIGLIVSARRHRWGLPLQGAGVFAIAFVLLNLLYPWFVQQFIVAPNELAKEKPYLAHNIRLTQAAYRLHDVQQQDFAAETRLNRQTLQNNQPTLRNIRLWDYRPLLSTYRQLQEIRLYYKFTHIDVDRYTIDGDYRQVMLAARELVFSQLPKVAQTWVNEHLKYTHGYGLAMSPVNRITAEGLPELYIKDIPPQSQVDLQIRQPALYYGEETNRYIFTGATTDEFDYPRGNDNAFTRYVGKGGVPINSIGRRLAYAYDLNSLQLLISNYLNNQSKIHYYRQIQSRISHVAPFLRLDSDPYLAIIDGRLQWIADAYTVSDRYPFSEPVALSPESETLLKDAKIAALVANNVNYIRNSVKVVVDAYDGTLKFFAMDDSEPILNTYRKIFPHLFLPKASIPPAVKAHFRYPQDLFKIQAQIYLAYHMSNPEEFYNREDLWQFPIQNYEDNEVVLQPYYTIMRLPGAEQAEFVLILPFTPTRKDNMISWMAARSNGREYGKLLLYEFPKQKLIFGPRQIEARIDQEPQISQQFTLWNQSGSKVIRGDLLVIPIEQSLLYVEPIYLRAERGELPELKRVIVAYDKDVVMANTLEAGLNQIFGETQPQQIERTVPNANTPSSNLSQFTKQALDVYRKAEAASRQGNWAEYGRQQQELLKILQQLNPSNQDFQPQS